MGPLSGAHLNPLVTLALSGGVSSRKKTVAAYIGAQILGAIVGVCCANAMFDLPLLSVATQVRAGTPKLFSEFVTSFGLLGAVVACTQSRSSATAGVVAAYVGGTFWFTSTGFGNPAVAIARGLAEGNVGIRPIDIPGFLMAEIAGGAAGAVMFGRVLRAVGKPATIIKRGVAG
jgi:glycerol uptake facilitator-like aquaporin